MPGPGAGSAGMSQGRGPVSPQRAFLPFVRAPRWVVNGQTIDSTNAALAGCVVLLFETGTNLWRGITLSDTGGNYVIDAAPGVPYFLVWYKAGGPDVAGTSVNTVLAVEA
jgi:hypothetical protein